MLTSKMIGEYPAEEPARLLITPGFIESIPDPIGTITTLHEMLRMQDLPEIGAIGMPHIEPKSVRTWAKLHQVELLEWARPDWMINPFGTFCPTIVYAGSEDDPMGLDALSIEIPVVALVQSG